MSTSVAYRLPDRTLAQLDRICAETGYTKTQALIIAIDRFAETLAHTTPERTQLNHVDLPEQRRP